LLNEDIDCKEVAKTAYNLFKSKYNNLPLTDEQQIEAFKILSERLQNGYKKALVSSSMITIKKYLLLSGGLDEDKIRQNISSSHSEFKNDVEKFNQHVKLAMEIMKSADIEIAKGLRGRDVNVFIIRTTQLLYFFYMTSGNAQAADYYKKLYHNFKKYQVVK